MNLEGEESRRCARSPPPPGKGLRNSGLLIEDKDLFHAGEAYLFNLSPIVQQ